MKTTFLTGFLLMCACTLAAQSQPNTKTISVEVTNSWIKDKSDAPVVLKIKDLGQKQNTKKTKKQKQTTRLPRTFGCCNERQ